VRTSNHYVWFDKYNSSYIAKEYGACKYHDTKRETDTPPPKQSKSMMFSSLLRVKVIPYVMFETVLRIRSRRLNKNSFVYLYYIRKQRTF
jgi:bisphosphoglycerate-dependent phosphoglycerate mutase